MWKLPYDPHPDYAAFEGAVYAQIDPRMRAFFQAGARSSIRLDEIDWGGVIVNGIPPLRYPAVVPASHAEYLKDSNVVFGLEVNGEARAYPKRILAWHEMAIDRVGGVELAIVYCTLCGTVIPFESHAGARMFHFGTSGLLYRSNKLMFDEETNSLWSTFEGVPVVGALVGSSVELRSRPVVTTTWKEWRTAHPETTALSIDTGYTRDYSEGAAYRQYSATDRLMFGVSKTDTRSRNKADVLVMNLADGHDPAARVPVAIDAQFLRKHAVYSFESLLLARARKRRAPPGCSAICSSSPSDRRSPWLAGPISILSESAACMSRVPSSSSISHSGDKQDKELGFAAHPIGRLGDVRFRRFLEHSRHQHVASNPKTSAPT